MANTSGKFKMIDFEKLSEWGLIYKINKEVLHPLGLALTRELETPISKGAVISPDLKFEYTDDVVQRNEAKLNAFIENREQILCDLLGLKPEEITDSF